MDKLKQYLENEKFDEAIKLLKSSDNLELPIKYYNLGYVYFEKQDFVKARFYFEKARSEGFINQKLNSSLKLVKEKLGVEQVESQYSFLDKTVLSTVNFHDDVFFSLLGLLLFTVIVSFVKAKKVLATVSVFTFCALAIVLTMTKDYRSVLLKEEAYVFQGPSRIFEPNQLISPGAKVVIQDEIKDWKYVRHPEIYRGWIYKAKVDKL